jgi:radical SAM protein with 4Fe4S-binding SPASM domain
MLRKDIFSIIRIAKKEQLEVEMITNGTLITKTSAENLFKSGLDSITFSIDAPASGPHDAIRGVEGAWKKAIEGMRHVSHVKLKHRNRKLKVSLDVVVTTTNYQLINKLIALSPQLGCDEIHFLPIIPKTTSARNLLLTNNDLKDLQTNYLPSISATMRDVGLPLHQVSTLISICRNRKSTLAGKYALPKRDKILCFQPWQMATVDPFGNVYPCCHACTFQNLSEDLVNGFWGTEDFKMGNLRSNTFREIWNSEEFIKFRNRCKSSPLPFTICSYCNYGYGYDLFLTALFKKRKLLLKFIYHLFNRIS